MTEFKDVCHLYMGCKMQSEFLGQHSIETVIAIHAPTKLYYQYDADFESYSASSDISHPGNNDKPILRPLSDISESEYETVCELAGIENGGCDRNWFIGQWSEFTHDGYGRFYPNDLVKVINYLRSIFIDVDELIEKGKAIDATTLKRNPYK